MGSGRRAHRAGDGFRYTPSHIEHTVDRLAWLHRRRDLVKGLRFVDEPKVLRFFFGSLDPLEEWRARLADASEADFGPLH